MTIEDVTGANKGGGWRCLGKGVLGLVAGGWIGLGAAGLWAGTEDVLREANRREAAGDFLGADRVLATGLNGLEPGSAEAAQLAFERDRLRRVRRDYPLTREALRAAVEEAVARVTAEEFERWLAEGRFDERWVDGERRYFGSSVSNLFFRHPELEPRRRRPKETAALQRAYLENAMAIRRAARDLGTPYVLPKRLRMRMTVTVPVGAVDAGVTVRAWLPVPRAFPHQTDLEILSTEPPDAVLAPIDSPIRSAYLERPASADGSARFEVDYRYEAFGVWFDLDRRGEAAPSARSLALESFLSEAPHVVFTPAMRGLAAEIGRDEKDPVRLARKFYEWIAANLRYSYAPEYSTIRNLGELCRSTGRGDCGQAAFLLMTLCRLSGIPARWQSGWAVFPGDETIHDWCEVHLEPWGWVPVDPYMGMYAMQYTPDLKAEERAALRDFYFGGLTQYRMAANGDHQQVLDPPKRSMRSDHVDFQRGEVEAGGTNLFYDQFRYRLEWREEPSLRMATRLVSAATHSALAYARVVELCDTFGPRFSGTTNLEAAIDWAIDRLRADGFESVRGEEVLVPRWIRGESGLEELSPVAQAIPVLALGGSTNTPLEGLVAPVLVVTNFADLEGRMAEAAGRIIVYAVPFTGYSEIVRYRYRGAIEAAKAGAVASLIRSATPFSLRTPHTGGMSYEEGIPRIPHAAIAVEDTERLLRWQRRGITPRLRLRLQPRTLPDVVSRNVVAEIRGREKPEEIVVVGGHLDSWDVGQGALDNAGGCVAAWEALRLVREVVGRPRRTLRLVLWTNEENGLRGARDYPERHRAELERHSVAIESDWGIGPVRGFAFTGSERAMAQLREQVPLLRMAGADQFRPGAGGSDLGPLLERGVPVMDLWTDRRDYFWFHHSDADTVDKIDPAELNQCVAALAVMAYLLGEMPEPLPR